MKRPVLSRGRMVAGIDEAGRGPLAGPVVAAAVILDPNKPGIRGLTDSKKLTLSQREELFIKIRERALAWGVARGTVAEIDSINILQATFLAMQRAVQRLKLIPELALVDGHICPKLGCEAQAIIRGDELEPAISAASIIAKVLRDRLMHRLDRQYPGYGFAQHKGYATPQHIAALGSLGPSRIHRKSFAPVSDWLSINQTEQLVLVDYEVAEV